MLQGWRDGLVGRVLACKHEGVSSDPQHPHNGHTPLGVAIHGHGWLDYSLRETRRSQNTDGNHAAPKQLQCGALPVSLMP